ncbi:MAG: HEAT repeat domain-containing protein [bacterium]
MLKKKDKILLKLADEFQIGKSANPNEQIKKLERLGKLPKKQAIEILNFFATQESNPQSLLHIVKIIGRYNSKNSAGILIDLLLWEEKYKGKFGCPEEYLQVRCMVTKILGNLQSQDALIPLLHILNNKNENYTLRLGAVEALGKIGDKCVVVPLIDIVSNDEEKSIYLRESAAKVLGILGDMRAIDPFINILETKKGIIDKFTFLKERVIEAIAKLSIKDERIIKALGNALLDESAYIRLNAIEALAEINDKRILDLIESMINDEEEDVGRSVINALYNITNKKYIIDLLEKYDLRGWCKDEIETILTEEEEE